MTLSALVCIYVLKCSRVLHHPRDLALDRMFPPQGGNDTATRRSLLPLATLGTHNAVSISAKKPLHPEELLEAAQISKFMQPAQVVLFTIRLTPCLHQTELWDGFATRGVWRTFQRPICPHMSLASPTTTHLSCIDSSVTCSRAHAHRPLRTSSTLPYTIWTPFATRFRESCGRNGPSRPVCRRKPMKNVWNEVWSARRLRFKKSTHVPAWNVTRLASERRERPLLGPTSFALRVLLPPLEGQDRANFAGTEPAKATARGGERKRESGFVHPISP